jgi:malate dehydrogenase (oxaloacetate-decarboxylating)
MLDFNIGVDKKTGEIFLETSLTGKPLLTTPQLNKGTAFTEEERRTFKLLGKLPSRIETLDEQVARAYKQYNEYSSRLQQNIYLNNLHDTNQVVFYKLVSKHLNEMLPTIYTPIVGIAVKQYSQTYRQPRGIYLSYEDRADMEEILKNRTNPNINIIVVTDGESILGIGDQGIGGMDIPIAKLMVYTLCGGINPSKTLPIFLDVGTNNETLLNDPFYLGRRHKRIHGKEYDDFIAQFVETVKKVMPKAFLHWEDFGRENARKILNTYEDELCTFNDDIQGTGVVALSALLAGIKVTKTPLIDQRIIVHGAGSAGTGICDQIVEGLCHEGISREEAYKRFWLIDRQGLLVEGDPNLTEAQRPYARAKEEIIHWSCETSEKIDLADTVNNVHPTVLIGCSAQGGAFNKTILRNMGNHCAQPIVLALSNPTELCEATPADVLEATDGRALIATGTPFEPVLWLGELRTIAQCNNALSFPGIGQGILSSKARRLTKELLWAACEALSEQSPALTDPNGPLLPSINSAQTVGKKIAQAVATQAIKNGLSGLSPEDQKNIHQLIDKHFWLPQYLPCRPKAI